MKKICRLSTVVSHEEVRYNKVALVSEDIAKERLKKKLHGIVDFIVDNSELNTHIDDLSTATIYTMDVIYKEGKK